MAKRKGNGTGFKHVCYYDDGVGVELKFWDDGDITLNEFGDDNHTSFPLDSLLTALRDRGYTVTPPKGGE